MPSCRLASYTPYAGITQVRFNGSRHQSSLLSAGFTRPPLSRYSIVVSTIVDSPWRNVNAALSSSEAYHFGPAATFLSKILNPGNRRMGNLRVRQRLQNPAAVRPPAHGRGTRPRTCPRVAADRRGVSGSVIPWLLVPTRPRSPPFAQGSAVQNAEPRRFLRLGRPS